MGWFSPVIAGQCPEFYPTDNWGGLLTSVPWVNKQVRLDGGLLRLVLDPYHAKLKGRHTKGTTNFLNEESHAQIHGCQNAVYVQGW